MSGKRKFTEVQPPLPEIDEELHSRQLAVYGKKAMQDIFGSDVLISGMNGLGAEIAKNIILAGVKSVTLHDKGVVSLWDMSSNFFFSEEDLGKNRCIPCVRELRDLNSRAEVSSVDSLTMEDLAKYKVVVFTDLSLETAIEYDSFCHSHEPTISFIFAEVRGLFGRVFCDFGPNFMVWDVDGEEPHSDILGEKKKPKYLHFKSLTKAMENAEDLILPNFISGRSQLLHLVFKALDMFQSSKKRLPQRGSENDVHTVINIIKKDTGITMDETTVRHFINGYQAVLGPMAAVFGGIVGEEVVKSCSGFFHPINQFFYLDSVESLPVEPLMFADVGPRNNRYDAQIYVLGHKLQTKLADANVFMVGSGALGCEFLKNLALMGVSCGQGKLTISDGDVVRKHNLTHQLLFRESHIGSNKSEIACGYAKKINNHLRIKAHQIQASPETDDEFDWQSFNVVINAVDNLNARLYVDSRCVYFGKPLLECGTYGPKCSTQMIIPNLTENYGASMDPLEKEPLESTIQFFPCNIHHCLKWAHDQFEILFEKVPHEVNIFLKDKHAYFSSMLQVSDPQVKDIHERALDCLDQRSKSFEECIKWARVKFSEYLVNRVNQLRGAYPENATKDDGSPFWSAPKRFPRPLEFSPSNHNHYNLVLAGAILKAKTLCIPIPNLDQQPIASFIEDVCESDLDTARVPININTKVKLHSVVSSTTMVSLVRKFEKKLKSLEADFKMEPITFDKDDDTNYHMDFVAGLANLRAENYDIPRVEKLKAAMMIAGPITPAIATSTAVAAGLVCLELYKVLGGDHKVEDYRNCYVNLALPLFAMSEPMPPKEVVHGDKKWTIWDRWDVFGNPTLKDLLKWLKEEKNIDAISISCHNRIIYSSLVKTHMDRMDKKVVDLVKNVVEGTNHVVLVVENNVDLPSVTVWFDDDMQLE